MEELVVAEETVREGQNGKKERGRTVNARNWRKVTTDGEWYTLPGNGEPALLRKVPLMALAARVSNMSNPLSADVVRWLKDGGYLGNITSPVEQADQFRRNMRAFIEVTQEVFIEPRIVKEFQCRECGTVFPRSLQRCPGRPGAGECGSQNFDWRPADYDSGEISPYDITDADYLWIVTAFVEGAKERTEKFRVDYAGDDGTA